MVETPGRGPGGSRFESGRSHCEGTGCSGVSYALHAGSIPALATIEQHTHGPVAQSGSAAPLQGEGCGFESRAVHRARPADVAQLEEARRSDRRQCGFDSRRQYDICKPTWTWRNGSAPASGAGGWEFESLRPDASKAMRGGGTGTTPASEAGGPGSSPGLAAIRCLCGCPFLESPTSVCCEGGGSFSSTGCGFESRRPGWGRSSSRKSSGPNLCRSHGSQADPSDPVSCDVRAFFVW